MAKKKADEKEYSVTIVGVTGSDLGKLHVLGNTSPKIGDPDEINSFVADVDFAGDEMEGTPFHEMESWVCAMDETPKGTIAAVSMDGELHVGRGKSWTTKDLGCPEGILSIWASGENEFFACGRGGERIHIAGTAVDLSPEPEKRALYGVHGSSPKHVMMVGDDGALFRYNGKSWRELEPPTNVNLVGVLCRSEYEVYVCGAEGALFRSDGDDWETIAAPEVTFYSMAWFRNALYLAGGEEGVFKLEKDGPEPIKSLPNPIYNLRTIDDTLLAFGGMLLAGFDGKKWTGGDFDF